MFDRQTISKTQPTAPPKPTPVDASFAQASSEPNSLWQSLALSARTVQPKLAVSQPDDPYEQEADRVADRVTRVPDFGSSDAQTRDSKPFFSSDFGDVQRQAVSDEEEEEEEQEAKQTVQCMDASKEIHRSAEGAPHNRWEIQSRLESSKDGGQALPREVQQEMGARMGTGFSDVRIHSDRVADQMSANLSASAFTLGRNIYFRTGAWNPHSRAGKTLLAHELVHTIQQKSGAQRKLQRALLYPVTPKQARVENIFVQGGLIDDTQIQRPSAIVDATTTIRSIATLILPWFNTALPSVDGKTLASPLTTEELARALAVFNKYYIPVTANPQTSMTNFKVGFRFPLPVIIKRNQEWAVNPFLIRQLAGNFSEAWEPYLDQHPKAATIPANMAAEVDQFLTDYSSTLKRGVRLYAMIITNPTEALPFLRTLFQRNDVGYELAVAVANNMVIHQASLLATLEHGYEIVGILYRAVQTAPADVAEKMARDLARANRVLKQFAVPKMVANPTSVVARDTGGDEQSAITITGLPPDKVVTPTVSAVPFSGGHDHDNNRQVGTLTPPNIDPGRTGKAEFQYRSNRAGGEEIVSINVGGTVHEVRIDVMIAGLVELQAGANYDLTGSTTQHLSPNNHFGTPATVAALQAIAAEYETYKQANNVPDWPRIGYNDISLPRGGVFDISGGWAPPHNEHRLGNSVDFRLGYTAAQRAVLRDIITRHGATILDEGDHWHLRF